MKAFPADRDVASPATEAPGPIAGGLAAALTETLDQAGAEGRRVRVWWRDDDATAPSAALDRLLAIATRHRVPLMLAAIPAGATPALADQVAATADIYVLQHGWSHTNHEPAGTRAAELGAARPLDLVLDELARGHAALRALFGQRFVPVLTPPWNRIAPQVAARRATVGLPVLSTFGTRSVGDGVVDCHLDPIAWRSGRGYIGDAKAIAIAAEEIAARTTLPDAPLGLLTHHLAHDEDVWQFVEMAIGVLAAHPAVVWPGPADLFGPIVG